MQSNKGSYSYENHGIVFEKIPQLDKSNNIINFLFKVYFKDSPKMVFTGESEKEALEKLNTYISEQYFTFRDNKLAIEEVLSISSVTSTPELYF